MNLPNKKPPEAKGAQQQFKQQTGRAQPFKPVVAQAKNSVSAQSVKRPVAPPVYRPQSKPDAVQQKTIGPSQMRTDPVAPPAYRPQPTPKVLQTKRAGGQQSRAGQCLGQPVAPPVYRPTAVQAKQPAVSASLVYRPRPAVTGASSVQRATSGHGMGSKSVIQLTKIRDLVAQLTDAGFTDEGQNGSHHRYKHTGSNTNLSLAYHNSADEAKDYQEREVRDAIAQSQAPAAPADNKDEVKDEVVALVPLVNEFLRYLRKNLAFSNALIEEGLATGCYPPKRRKDKDSY